MTVSDLLEQPYNKSDNAIKLATIKQFTACFKILTTTGNKQCEHNLSTVCEQICCLKFYAIFSSIYTDVIQLFFPHASEVKL
jgi:hypothetical protein